MTDQNPPPNFQDYRPSHAGGPRPGVSRTAPQRRPSPMRARRVRSSSGPGQVIVIMIAAIAVAVAAGLAFVVAAPPTDLIRSHLVAAVKRSTGRDLTIGGPATFKVFPAIGISLQDVRLGAPPQMDDVPLVTMDRLDVRLKLWPLLSGNISVDTLILTKPVFDLRIDANGRKTWDFSRSSGLVPVRLAQAHTDTASDAPSLVPESARDYFREAEEADEVAGPGGTSIAALPDLEFGDVRIEDGTVRFADARRNTHGQIESINVLLRGETLARPLNATGDLVWKGERVAITATLTSLEALLRSAPTRLVTTFESPRMLAGYDGSVEFDNDLSLDGALILESRSLRQLADWFGTALPQTEGFGPLSLEGRLKVAGKTVSLLNAKSSLNGGSATGDVTISTGGIRPYIKGDLHVTELDLNKYIGSATAPGEATSDPSGSDRQSPAGAIEGPQTIEDLLLEPGPRVRGYTGREGWSNEPVDWRLLAAADADITLVADRLVFQKINAGRSRLVIALQDATMRADLQEIALYGGVARGIVTLNTAPTRPDLHADIVIDGVSAQPLLQDAADIDWLVGSGNLSLAVTSQGSSQREIIEELDGTADFRFTDGALVGFNIAQTIRGLSQGRASGLQRVPTQKTDFSDFSATFKITKGVAETSDMRMASPLMRLTGAGRIMLPPRQMDLTVRPKLVADLAGQGGQTALDGIEIPVRIHGPFAKLNYTPDLGEVLNNPDKAAETVRKIGQHFKGKNAQEIIDGFIGNDEGGKKKIDANKLLKGLFGGKSD